MASLKLSLTDAAGQDLNDHVTIHLFSQESARQFQVSQQVLRDLQINGIDVNGGRLFRVEVTPANHRVIQFFINLRESRVTKFAAACPVDPAKVVSINAPAFTKLRAKAREILMSAAAPPFNDGAGRFLQGETLYAALDKYPLLKACLLNIVAKAADTRLQDGQSCLDHCHSLVRLEQDRCFLRTTAALLEETGESNAFHRVPADLHAPVPGYRILSSFKTFDRYGNLQLTFQRQGETGDDYIVDVDIDDAQGIEHLFQVARNAVRGPSNPYDIRDILLRQQPPTNPGYDFRFAAAAATA